MARVRTIGNSLGVILPAAALASAGFQSDDNVRVVASPGEIRLVRDVGDSETATEQQVAAGLRFMQRYSKAFKRLASL